MDLRKLGSNFTCDSQAVIPEVFHYYNVIDRTEDDILWQDEDDIDPFNYEDAEVVVEGELYYLERDKMSTVELYESDY